MEIKKWVARVVARLIQFETISRLVVWWTHKSCVCIKLMKMLRRKLLLSRLQTLGGHTRLGDGLLATDWHTKKKECRDA